MFAGKLSGMNKSSKTSKTTKGKVREERAAGPQIEGSATAGSKEPAQTFDGC